MSSGIVSEGIVLTRTNYGEADRILTIITPDHGKVRVIAKGVRKSTSKLAGGIELFSICHITFIKGKGDINTLISTRLITHYGNIVKVVERTMFGYELLKITHRATEDNAGEDYFDMLATALAALDDDAISLDIIRLWFYMHLLKYGGHSPNLLTQKNGEKLEMNKTYNFDTDNMIFIEKTNSTYNSQHIKLLRLSIGLESPKKLTQIIDADKVLIECLEFAITMLSQHVRI